MLSDAGEGGEAIIRYDELGSPFGEHLAHRIVGVAARIIPTSAPSIADWLPITDKCLSIAISGTPLRANRSRTRLPFSESSRGPAPGSRNSWVMRAHREPP